ncbi:Hypothetical protein D9617_15g043360 [Elsinoe fawcettii]|nr:Hypothetical protein D9617_15g043360 [Elsinoe fawcettii]
MAEQALDLRQLDGGSLNEPPQSGQEQEPQTEYTLTEASEHAENGQRALRSPSVVEIPSSMSLVRSSLPESDVLDTQMFALFYDTYLPADTPIWRQITYLRSVAEIVPYTALFKLAKRTLGLAHLAASTKNPRIEEESAISYSRLLNLLRASLQRSDKEGKRTTLREILSTMALLTHMSDHAGGPAHMSPAWVVHLDAARRLLDTKAFRRLDVEQPLDKGLVRHVASNSFYLALAKRQTWSTPQCFFDHESKGMTDLLRVFQGLPTMLEETDWALCIDDNLPTLKDLIRRLQLILEEARLLFPDVQNPRRMNNCPGETLDQGPEDEILTSCSSVFPGLFSPMSHLRTMRLTCLTTLVIMTQCTILRIWAMRPESTVLASDETRESIERDVRLQAVRLCKITPSLIRRDQVVAMQTLRLSIMLARNVFEQQTMIAELDWCNRCLDAVQAKMDRLGEHGIRTLCKIADVVPGMAEAGRYGSMFNYHAFTVGK